MMKLFLLIWCITVASTLPTTRTSLRKNIGSRIIGGSVAASWEYPYIVAITKTTPDGNYFCGGTILSNEWILTAGQCADSAILFVMQLGSNILDGSDSNLMHVSADLYYLHPDYNPLTLNSDLGLISLRQPVEYSDYLKQIGLLAYGVLQAGDSAIAVGWGQIADDQPGIVDELRYVQVTTLSNSECSIYYGSQVTDSMVCVGGNYNEGTCLGDSGSPLIQNIGHGYAMFVGVSSFVSQNGCESTDPSGFTRIYENVPWITNVTGRTA